MFGVAQRFRAAGGRFDLAPRKLSPALLSAVDQGVVSGFGFLAAMLAARLVGIGEFGRFALVLIIVAFAQGLHNALVTAPMMTLAGSRQRASAVYDGSVLTGAVILSVLMAGAVALILAALFTIRGDAIPFGLVAAASALTTAQNVQFTLRRMLFARRRGGLALVMDLMRSGAFPLCIIVLWLLDVSIGAVTLLWCLAATALATTLPFAWPVLASRGARPRLGAVARRHWRLARWLLPVIFVTFGQEQVVWILVGIMIGDEAVGGLRAAQYLVGLVLVLLAATENIVPTAAGRFFAEGGVDALRRYLLRVTVRLGALVATLLLVVAAPAEAWLRLVFGAPYAAYATSVQVLALGVLIVLIRDMTAHFFRATQHTSVIFQSSVVGLVASLTILYPLLQHGVTGAAIVIVAGHAASLAYLLIAAGRHGAFDRLALVEDGARGKRPC